MDLMQEVWIVNTEHLILQEGSVHFLVVFFANGDVLGLRSCLVGLVGLGSLLLGVLFGAVEVGWLEELLLRCELELCVFPLPSVTNEPVAPGAHPLSLFLHAN